MPGGRDYHYKHASERDVQRKRVRRADKIGNYAANQLAVQGACLHAVPCDKVQQHRLRSAVAEDVQRMMVGIVEARNAHRQRAATVGIFSISSESPSCTRSSSNSSSSDLPRSHNSEPATATRTSTIEVTRTLTSEGSQAVISNIMHRSMLCGSNHPT